MTRRRFFDATPTYREHVDAARRAYVTIALAGAGGDVNHAARVAGVSTQCLRLLLRRHGVSSRAYRRRVRARRGGERAAA